MASRGVEDLTADLCGSLRRLSVAEFHRMVDAGILREGDRVELLEGLLVEKMVRKPSHDACVSLVEEALSNALPASWFCRIQSAITTADSEPEPDVAVVRGPRRRYRVRHPGAEDVALIVEVADTSVDRDRIDKGRLYARAGIASYWIVNLLARQVEIYTGPQAEPARYAERTILGPRETASLVIAGRSAVIAVRDLLP
jgi:Uma2 family endonuclease